MRTPDGRVLAGASFGPADGEPVLFIAGAATGRSMAFGEDLLEALGVRLLTMDRPGMGASDADTGRTLASTVDDYREFVSAALGNADARVPVVANSQGGVFGLGAAAAGWATRLVLVSPADELAHPAIRAMLPAEATGLADLAQQDPAAAAEVLAGFDAEAMEQMVLSGSGPEDRAFYAAPAFLERYRSALAEGFANEGAGYIRDTLIAMRAWNLPFDRIRVPVSVLFGAKDLTHSPDHGEVLASRIPGARRIVFADAGGAFLWTHARAALEAVLDR
ncbi:alpha/beta hydrolase [Leucobacter iarius]|uniref:alpha/beta fold hydrolase n=1 Tax=Leucobacter iarius TaxID=333963 RepID=UPI0031DDB354